VFATAMYITVTIPAIRTVVTPVEGVDTREDQIEALRVLSAGNTLIIVLLGGVLALQVREYGVYCFLFSVEKAELRDQQRFVSLSFFFPRGYRHAHTQNTKHRGDRSGRGDWKRGNWRKLRQRKRKKEKL
jgi:hypothetical protein